MAIEWRWSESHSDKGTAAWLFLALLLLMCGNDNGYAHGETVWTTSWLHELGVARGSPLAGIGTAASAASQRLVWISTGSDLVWLRACQLGGAFDWPPLAGGLAGSQSAKLVEIGADHLVWLSLATVQPAIAEGQVWCFSGRDGRLIHAYLQAAYWQSEVLGDGRPSWRAQLAMFLALLALISLWVVVLRSWGQQQIVAEARRLRSINRSLLQLANIDELTGIYNRRGFALRISEACRDVGHVNQPLSLALIDLDKFKQINDRYGHQVGDRVLCEVIERIKQAAGENALLGRSGGDELMICWPGLSLSAARWRGERICHWLAVTPLQIGAQTVQIYCSIGVAQWRGGDSLESLIARADEGLYRAKRKGGNTIEPIAD